jgi:transcription elongation factor GreA
MAQEIPMTAVDYKRLKDEIELLKSQERARIREELAQARSYGDFSENAELEMAKQAHSALEGRIKQLEETFERAYVIESTGLAHVAVGATVTAADLETLDEICFNIGANGIHDHDGIVVTPDSPLGKGFMGKAAEDEVEVETPAGKRRYRVVAVEFAAPPATQEISFTD